MESEFAGTYNVHFYTLFLLVTNYFKINWFTDKRHHIKSLYSWKGGGIKYTNVCASVEMMRWQTVYLCSGLKDVLTNCLLLHLTNGHSSQNEWSQNFPVKAHLHNTYCVIITCNVSWSFRGAVSEELRWQSVQKAQNSKKNNDCYSIVFSKECSKWRY